MLKKILIGVGVVIVGLAVFIASRPSSFHVSRSITIAAPALNIYPYVNDLHQWNTWSPWAKLDPEAKMSFEGTYQGIGSVMKWDGNKEVGKGSMTITESRAFDLIQFRLDFEKPMKGVSTSEFTFLPEGDQTRVTWSMSGQNNFIGKAVSLVFNCEKMIGGQYEKGLTDLKTVVETINPVNPAGSPQEIQ